MTNQEVQLELDQLKLEELTGQELEDAINRILELNNLLEEE